MPQDPIAELLTQLEKHAQYSRNLQEMKVNLSEDDKVRLAALAEIYALSPEQLAASLLHTVLHQVEAKMPYKAGSKVIREEDGEPIYEDIGPMPRYLEAKKRIERSLNSPGSNT